MRCNCCPSSGRAGRSKRLSIHPAAASRLSPLLSGKKASFATEFLPNEANCPLFVNAALIAAGLSPFRPDWVSVRAGRLMLNMIHDYVRKGESFAFETTLSGRGYARWIPHWQAQGYRVKLFFLRLPTVEAAIKRVAQRVLEGGHDVPQPVIRRRFHAGWRNFQSIYRDLVDAWAVYDSSGDTPVLLTTEENTL